jgi:hypothetical protein
MSIIQYFSEFMRQSITVEPWTGAFDKYSAPIVGGPVSIAAYIEEKTRKIQDSTGQDRVSNTTLYVAIPMSINDRVTMPAGFKGPVNPPIISSSNWSDDQGFDHCEVYL